MEWVSQRLARTELWMESAAWQELERSEEHVMVISSLNRSACSRLKDAAELQYLK